MTRRKLTALIATVLAAVIGATAAADDASPLAEARRWEQAVQQAIATAEPSIACLLVSRGSTPISGNRMDPSGFDNTIRPPDGFGSGVVIDSQGLILTNYHVVKDETRIQVRLPGLPASGGAEARILAADSYSDLAVLALNGKHQGLSAIRLGRGENLRKGSWIIGLGHPYAAGFRDGSPNATWGIISNLARRHPGSPNERSRKEALNQYGTLIQTDARLQLGQSGGALVDLEGRLVGLTTAHAALTGYEAAGGFALPIDSNIKRIVEVLARGEEVEYGYLGITANVTSHNYRSIGVPVESVIGNSPAEHAHLKHGDVILEVNGQPVREYDDMALHLACSLAGRRAILKVARGNEPTRIIEATLAKAMPTPGATFIAANRPKPVYNLRVDYTSVVGRISDPIVKGVIVREYANPNPEKKPPITEGEIILKVNDKAVATPSEFYAEAELAAKSGAGVKLTMSNGRVVNLP